MAEKAKTNDVKEEKPYKAKDTKSKSNQQTTQKSTNSNNKQANKKSNTPSNKNVNKKDSTPSNKQASKKDSTSSSKKTNKNNDAKRNEDKVESKAKRKNISNSIKNEEQKTSNKKDKEDKKTQLEEQKSAQVQETVAKELEKNKTLPAEELSKINTRLFQNIALAVAIMLYLNFIILGFINIENSVFITDLKVFGVAILAVSIGMFEYAYKKDSGRHTIHGIEILLLAFATIALIYVDLMLADRFVYITAFLTYVFSIYYVAKSIIVYNRMKKQYFVNSMKEMIKK